MSDFLYGAIAASFGWIWLAAYLWRCNAPLRADAKVGRARRAAIAKDSARKRLKRAGGV